MLKISSLTMSYNKHSAPAVDNLSLEVKAGEIYGFIGPNGAGKSTTIKSVTGILKFTAGSIYVDGIDLVSNPLGAKRLIGFVPDEHTLYDRLTGKEFLDFISNVFAVPTALKKERLERYTDLFELQSFINDQLNSYSHGMRQKLFIIASLIHEPKLWILDEPMTGLDPKAHYNLKKLMREHASKGNAVFFSSHQLDVVEKVCDRVGIINNGKLVIDCAVSELNASATIDASLEDLFLAITANLMEECPFSEETTASHITGNSTGGIA